LGKSGRGMLPGKRKEMATQIAIIAHLDHNIQIVRQGSTRYNLLFSDLLFHSLVKCCDASSRNAEKLSIGLSRWFFLKSGFEV